MKVSRPAIGVTADAGLRFLNFVAVVIFRSVGCVYPDAERVQGWSDAELHLQIIGSLRLFSSGNPDFSQNTAVNDTI